MSSVSRVEITWETGTCEEIAREPFAVNGVPDTVVVAETFTDPLPLALFSGAISETTSGGAIENGARTPGWVH